MGIFDKLRGSLDGGDAEGALTESSAQSDEEKKLAGWVKSKIEEVRTGASRITQEGIWMTNIAYLLGFNSMFYDTQLKQFQPLNKNSTGLKRNRIHANQILPACQNRLARLCKNPPRYEVRPNSQSTDDKEAATLGLEIINNVWDEQKINVERISLLMWVQQCGHAFLKTCFDPMLGEPLMNPDGTFSGEFEGQVRVDVVSPFEVFVDPLAKSMKEARWLIHAKVRKLDYFKDHYPERGEAVKPEDAWLQSLQYDLRINTLTQAAPQGGSSTLQQKNAAVELAYYEGRSKKHPEGRMIVVANGVVLENKELPIGEIAFSKFDDVVIGGKFYPESCITHARPCQDQFDRNMQKSADWVNRLLAGKYVVPRGANLTQESINDQSGEVVEYDVVPNAPAGGEPHAVQIPMLPAYVFTDRDKLKEEIYGMFGLSEVSRGQLPSAGIPAVGMQLLVEQDETRIGIETEQHEHAYASTGRHILKYISSYYKTPRRLKVKDKASDYQIKEYVGADLKTNFDVQVVRGSTIPNNKFMQRQEILNAFGQGLLGDPQDPAIRENVLGRLQYGDTAGLWEDYTIDMQQINRDIKSLEAGEPCREVDEMENHALHIKVKNRFIKSEKFDHLDPTIQANFKIDRENHVIKLMHLQNPGLKTMGAEPPESEIMNDMQQMGPDQGLPPAGPTEQAVPPQANQSQQMPAGQGV